ncbi:Ldb16p KNAG_0I01170 [Huiozyma naganishii CBS 8797]|uniref:Uncharacterized protein n=1 Tax=Huiozyma naganishii (strain ATCC MYA-139 / BCRC 22969 / CBS 8797 / KCTC 17520 / NBRC 10181 / NCYC 3082 / Yp74L-3) TaxID=1071383 RepID=J7RQ58_HUIN7|nr:hypothetical protein KNAG_0I01170 [Kazachstania naganishii CBS 8797]CCK71908.1 hypothetical protein KNAG_0I01170 [Kazachstania naganishii CBS 8797]
MDVVVVRESFTVNGLYKVAWLGRTVLRGCLSTALRAVQLLYKVFLVLLRGVVSVLRGVVYAPVAIVGKVWFQFVTLPANVPLYLFWNTSVQSMKRSVQSSNWWNTYIFTAVLQYSIAIVVFGVLIGVTVGGSLGLMHSFCGVPNYIVDVTSWMYRLKDYLMQRVHRLWAQFKSKVEEVPIAKVWAWRMFTPAILQNAPKTPLKPMSMASSRGSTGTIHSRRSRRMSGDPLAKVKSKEEQLHLASALPSDFFQSDTRTLHATYQTPPASPFTNTMSGESDLWDTEDTLRYSTLRTQENEELAHGSPDASLKQRRKHRAASKS